MGLSCFCSRLLFGLVLTLVSIKGFYDIDSNKGFVSQNIRLLSEKLQKYNINIIQYRKYSALVILIENYLLLISAISTIVSFNPGKYFAFIALIIDILLVHNPYFYGEPAIKVITFEFIGLFGAILNSY